MSAESDRVYRIIVSSILGWFAGIIIVYFGYQEICGECSCGINVSGECMESNYVNGLHFSILGGLCTFLTTLFGVLVAQHSHYSVALTIFTWGSGFATPLILLAGAYSGSGAAFVTIAVATYGIGALTVLGIGVTIGIAHIRVIESGQD